ncbi:MAG: cysteine desulfurase [Chitinophagales bacterium]|nr:cysteine desulfurase [Bacteroidota bacterium]
MKTLSPAIQAFDAQTLQHLRAQFPILQEMVNGRQLVYFDNAATTQKPEVVLNTLLDYYRHYNSNIHRGAHFLSNKATQAYEDARQTMAQFINATHTEEINFVRGTTEGINLIANAYGGKFLEEGDEIMLSTLEHHSNIVPWQMIAAQKKCRLQVIPLLADGSLDIHFLRENISPKTKIVSLNYVSNALGTINPIAEIAEICQANGSILLVDAAQAAPHLTIDVQALGCDFLALSGHKMYAPTGIGILWGKKALLEAMNPYQGGGEMIASVRFAHTTYNHLPYKFEAGTPNIADAIGLGAAARFLQDIGLAQIAAHEQALLHYATEQMQAIEGLRIVGTSAHKAGVISFLIADTHPFDVGVLLDKMGIATRTGHHCCQPLMEYLGIDGTIRVSFGLYNSFEEIDYFINALQKVLRMLR